MRTGGFPLPVEWEDLQTTGLQTTNRKAEFLTQPTLLLVWPTLMRVIGFISCFDQARPKQLELFGQLSRLSLVFSSVLNPSFLEGSGLPI